LLKLNRAILAVFPLELQFLDAFFNRLLKGGVPNVRGPLSGMPSADPHALLARQGPYALPEVP
jgi:hypothetical protein